MNIARDTAAEAAAIQARIVRAMTGPERVLLALEMCLVARELTASRLREQHPDWGDKDVKKELLRYAFDHKNLPPPLR